MIKTVLGTILLLLCISGYAGETSPQQAKSLLRAAAHADGAGQFDIFLKLVRVSPLWCE